MDKDRCDAKKVKKKDPDCHCQLCTCKQAGTLRTAATPKGQITEELTLLPPRAIYGECKLARLTVTSVSELGFTTSESVTKSSFQLLQVLYVRSEWITWIGQHPVSDVSINRLNGGYGQAMGFTVN